MSESKMSKFYVIYAEPKIDIENGKIRQMHQVPVSSRFHTDIQSAKKEYDELSARIGKLLGLAELVNITSASV